MFPAKRTEHLEGRLEPGKKEPVQTLILDSHKQKLVADKYGLRLCSTSEALSLPALSLTTFFFFFCTLDSNQWGLISGQSTIKFAFAPPHTHCCRQQNTGPSCCLTTFLHEAQKTKIPITLSLLSLQSHFPLKRLFLRLHGK